MKGTQLHVWFVVEGVGDWYRGTCSEVLEEEDGSTRYRVLHDDGREEILSEAEFGVAVKHHGVRCVKSTWRNLKSGGTPLGK